MQDFVPSNYVNRLTFNNGDQPVRHLPEGGSLCHMARMNSSALFVSARM